MGNEVKKVGLFVPAWWPCSFFEEQQAIYADEYEIYNIFGSCRWIPQKEQLRRLLMFDLSNRLESRVDGSRAKVEIQCAKYNSIPRFARAISRMSERVGQLVLMMTMGKMPNFIYIQSISEVAILVVEWAKKKGVKIILAEHVLYIRHEVNYITRRKEQLYSLADQVLCVSNYLYRNLLTNGFKMKSVSIVGNLVNEHGIPTQWKDLRKNGRIMFVATHLADKDIATLFDVAARMKEKELKIDIFGLEGSELYARNETIAQHISNIGLLDVITIKGKLSHDILLEKYSQYSVLLSTSISETFGLAVAEAIAHGTPVVCTDSGGIHDFVNEKNGIVVPIKDANRISEAILEAIHIPYEYEKMSQFIIHKYGIDSYKKTNYHYLGVHGD